ncbi:MAG: hypothetical protein H0X66_21860 [Verrucomicrobia bacterium]|nr:hypothetical protein [Verrucomicrobiota bacterium]
MPSQYDSSDFVDSDLETARRSPYASNTAGGSFESLRAPTREELDSKVSDAQVKLAELKRAQEELERERTALEEMRRRQIEFQTGREEMLQSLTRGTGLLEEAEFSARRDAEQMSNSLADLKDALLKVQAINHEIWSKENYGTELTRALTTIENARMEWNAARIKFSVLSGVSETETTAAERTPGAGNLGSLNFMQLCKVGLALTWPILVVGFAIFITLVFKR